MLGPYSRICALQLTVKSKAILARISMQLSAAVARYCYVSDEMSWHDVHVDRSIATIGKHVSEFDKRCNVTPRLLSELFIILHMLQRPWGIRGFIGGVQTRNIVATAASHGQASVQRRVEAVKFPLF